MDGMQVRAMPHLDFYHHDSIYWVSAHSVALGDPFANKVLIALP